MPKQETPSLEPTPAAAGPVKVYAPPTVLWEQEFVALALVSDICSVPDPSSQNCEP